MNDPVRARLDAWRQQKRVQAESLIISLFGDAVVPRGGRIWLGSLIRLLAPLGVAERLVRTSVFRLTHDEWLQAETVGRRSDYVLSPSGRRRFDEAARHIYASHAPLWDRRWRLILIVGQFDAKGRERLRQALFWQGFGVLGGNGADCYVHPSADLRTALDALVAEGHQDLLPGLMPLLAADCRLGGTASNAELVERAWNLDQLAVDYAGFVATYMPALAEMRRNRQYDVSDADAFLLRLLLIHDYRRLLLRDPELPDVLLPGGWPGQTARLLCRELYRRLASPSERHLDAHLQTADGTIPVAVADPLQRFPEDDPLATIAL